MSEDRVRYLRTYSWESKLLGMWMRLGWTKQLISLDKDMIVVGEEVNFKYA